MNRLRAPLLTTALGLVTLGWSDDIAVERSTPPRVERAEAPRHSAPTRKPLDGAAFPEGVLALTWDDGPDVNTLPLARYLRSKKVSATFFVVGHWADGLSEEPGIGAKVYETGYEHMPVLPELVTLGHRLGGHTESHVRLAGAPSARVIEQVGNAARAIDPHVSSELRMFRAPGGMWDHEADVALDTPFFADLRGPFHWDIDGKDWEGSLYCPTGQAADCEPSPIAGRARVRADVVARRYLALAESRRRGIVLMHDRVGAVGSDYALNVAKHLIPALSARGFVFAAPVLAFSELSTRLAVSATFTQLADFDGDGKADVCRVETDTLGCARAVSTADSRGVPRATFESLRPMLALPKQSKVMGFGDIDGDHRADVCLLTESGLACAMAPFAKIEEPSPLSKEAWSGRLADVDGDGRADACFLSPKGILCAVSTGHGAFASPRVWLATGDLDNLTLADLDGDHRADACWSRSDGVTCALSNGSSFGLPSIWSLPGDFADTPGGLDLADLNGDDRADLCAASRSGVSCAFSDGRRFKRASIWSLSRSDMLLLADINGDRRADLCAITPNAIDCGMAP